MIDKLIFNTEGYYKIGKNLSISFDTNGKDFIFSSFGGPGYSGRGGVSGKAGNSPSSGFCQIYTVSIKKI